MTWWTYHFGMLTGVESMIVDLFHDSKSLLVGLLVLKQLAIQDEEKKAHRTLKMLVNYRWLMTSL
jgi:hypothetical protein